jgi:hypothetical protein
VRGQLLPRRRQGSRRCGRIAVYNNVDGKHITEGSFGIGTSGANVGALSTANTWGGAQSYAAKVDLRQDFALSGDITPTQITSNQDDYAPTGNATASVFRLSSDASRDITGIANGADGRVLLLMNVGSFDIVLKNDTTSTAANRFLFGTDHTLSAGQAIALIYDATATRWKALHTTGILAYNAQQSLTQPQQGVALRNIGAAQFNLVNGKIAESHSANAVTYAVKGLDGNDPSTTNPVTVIFGDGTKRTITSALSLTVSSGSTLNAADGVPFNVWIVLIDDAGTLRLGVQQCVNGTSFRVLGFPGTGVLSSTAEGGAGGADSPGITYTASAVSSKQFVVVGVAEYDNGLTTAGTWDASPSRIQLFGPGMKMPGDIIQSVPVYSFTEASGTTQIPFDDTIPQNTEGDQYLSGALTPRSKANVLTFDGKLSIGASTTSAWMIVALFQDATINAIASGATFAHSTVGAAQTIPLVHHMRANTIAQTTFNLRAGLNAANTLYFLKNPASGALGDTWKTGFTIMEQQG